MEANQEASGTAKTRIDLIGLVQGALFQPETSETMVFTCFLPSNLGVFP
jgi:hypothetical protein